MKTAKRQTFFGALGGAIGKGLIAGLAGTAAITLSQIIEMKITGREASNAPAEAASKVLDVEAVNEKKEDKFTKEVHWAYGTTWGIGRGLMALCGIRGWAGTALHFAAITGAAMTLQPKLGVAPPPTEWEPETIAVSSLHHAVYAIVAGFVYDAIDKA